MGHREVPGRPELLEEERRLLYVAMTRAKQELHLIAPVRFYVTQQSRTGDKYVHGTRSRFLTEAVLARLDQTARTKVLACDLTAQLPGTVEPFKTAITLVFVRSWPFVLWAVALLALVLASNAMSLWIYHDYYASKLAIVDLEDVLKDHVNRYGRMGLNEKQAASVAQTFGHAMETRLADYQSMGYLVLVKQTVVKGVEDDLTADLKDMIEADVAPLVEQIQSERNIPE